MRDRRDFKNMRDMRDLREMRDIRQVRDERDMTIQCQYSKMMTDLPMENAEFGDGDAIASKKFTSLCKKKRRLLLTLENEAKL